MANAGAFFSGGVGRAVRTTTRSANAAFIVFFRGIGTTASDDGRQQGSDLHRPDTSADWSRSVCQDLDPTNC